MPNFPLFARFFIVILVVAATFATYPAQAQPWSGIIDSSRAIDWSKAGVPGGIPPQSSRTQCGTTIQPTTNPTVIQSALNACGPNQYVKLGAGTFTLSGGVNVTVNNTTLRGSGPTQTIIKFVGSGGCISWPTLLGMGACNNGNWLGIRDEVLNGNSWTTPWTAGYAKGTTTLTVGSTAQMAPGRLLWLDQQEESTDDGGLINTGFSPLITVQQHQPYNRNDTADGALWRTQYQIVRVQSIIDATHVVIDTPLYMPSWRSSQNPAVSGWGRTDNSTAFGIGLEDLTIENTFYGDWANIMFGQCYGCWIKNVRSTKGGRSHVWVAQSAHVEIRDSYFYGGITSNAESYGVEPFGASDLLVINSITESTTAAYQGACGGGCVVAYNYNFGSYYTDAGNCVNAGGRNSACNWPTHFTAHGSGGGMYLLEGNETNGLFADNTHGESPLNTAFRNYFHGNDDQGGKTYNRLAIEIDAGSRAVNIVGNVLGDPTISETYQVPFGQVWNWTTQPAIYQLGYRGDASFNDPIVASSMLRWGNYDTANGSVQWNSSEVPTTGIPRVNGNPVPANHNLPNSFFLASEPTSWWATPWGTPPWPPIGPDVAGGNTALGGHVYDIPAKLCFNHLSADTTNYPGTTPPILAFNANNCYTSSGSSTAPPIVTLTLQ